MILEVVNREFKGNQKVLSSVKDALSSAKRLPYKYTEREVAGLFNRNTRIQDLYELSTDGINLLLRNGVIKVVNGTVELLDASTLLFNINTSIPMSILRRVALSTLSEDLDHDAVEVFCTAKDISKYVVPTVNQLIKACNSRHTLALKQLAYMGLNVHYDIESTLDRIGYGSEGFNGLMLDYSEDVYKFLCSTAKDWTCYTLYYLCTKYDMTVESLNNCRFILDENNNVKLGEYRRVTHLY